MKRILALVLALALVLGVAATALAADRGGHYDRRGDRHDGRDRVSHGDRGSYDRDRDGHDRSMPFKWRDNHRMFGKHHMERIHDREFAHRYPGLHAFRWHGYGERREGFWHNGREIRDAILFFDDRDEVVGFGYMDGGVFIYVREDGYSEERDPFFLLRWFR